MRVVARISPGPSWVPDRDVYGQGAPIEAHLQYMRARFDDQSLLLGGPLTRGMSGFAVLEVLDLKTAEAFARGDPAVQAGVLVYELGELVPYFDAFSGVRESGSAAGLGRRGREMRPSQP